MEVIERWVAAVSDHPKYYTGKRCKRGHNSQRYTSTGACVQCRQMQYTVKKRKLTTNHVQVNLIMHKDDASRVRQYASKLKQERRE